MANPIVTGGVGSPQSIYATSTIKYHRLGDRGYLPDGRVFYYSSYVASGALQEGNLLATSTTVANHNSVAYASGGAAGSNSVTVTLGATAATAGQYEDGWITHIDGTNPGQMRKIANNPAADASATLAVETYDNWTSDVDGELTLRLPTYGSVIQTPGNAEPHIVGVNCVALADSSSDTTYFWAQTYGECGVIGDGSVFLDGSPVLPASAGTADAGQITLAVDDGGTGQNSTPLVGYIIEASDATSDGDGRLVDLRIRA